MQKTVLLVSKTRGHLVSSIKLNLRNESYHVIDADADVDEINQIDERFGVIFICADEKLIREQQALNYIKDRAIMNNIPIFVIGNKAELTAIRVIIPKDIIKREFLKPTSMADLVHDFIKLTTQRSNRDKKKILVVDDSGAMLRNIKSWLEDKYAVSLVNSAAMAIKYVSLNRPDLILLDYEMPIIDGRQVLEMLRAEVDFAHIPVIFLTGKDDKASIVKVMELKPQGYLLKSLEPEQIIKAVDDFFLEREALRL